MVKGRAIRYSESFKLQVIEQIESGRFGSPHEASRVYGIKGTRTVQKWLTRYGKSELIPKKILIMSKDEINENQALKKRVRDLEKAFADAFMLEKLSESYFEIACKRLNMDPEEFKKKHATMLSKQQDPK